VLLAGLSTGHKIGLAVVAAVFISFALISSFVAPRRRPDFPGKNGLSVFIIACVVLFAAMLAAVEAFGGESEKRHAKSAAAQSGPPVRTIKVQESEWKITLPPTATLSQGKVTFDVRNTGKVQHDLSIRGGNVAGPSKTPLISPGGTAKLTVSLSTGNYTLYCSVPGHEQLGMKAQISVG
jgi:plastocyanin